MATLVNVLQFFLLFLGLSLKFNEVKAAPHLEADSELEPGIEAYVNYCNEIHVDDEQAEAETRNAIQSPMQRWPANTLYYTISSDYSPEEAANVRQALQLFNEQTCVSFEEMPEGGAGSNNPLPPRYLSYTKSENLCGTRVGYNPLSPYGPHNILMNGYCLARIGVIQHETLHVLGLYHEQARPDRDSYVEIDYENIPRKYWSQFYAQSEYKVTTYDIPYDYDSVMHYSQFAFAIDKTRPTIRALIDGQVVERNLGQTKRASEGDLAKIRIMYKCNQ